MCIDFARPNASSWSFRDGESRATSCKRAVSEDGYEGFDLRDQSRVALPQKKLDSCLVVSSRTLTAEPVYGRTGDRLNRPRSSR